MEQKVLDIEKQFKFSGKISRSKLIEYLPASLLSSGSSLLLGSVDGIVVGNIVSSEALSSVSVFSPVFFLAGMISVLAANGIAVCLSVAAGRNDREEIRQIRASSRVLMIVFSFVIILLQIPATFFLLSTYGLPDEMKQMVWQYAIGILLASPFGFISTVGAYQLQIVGKMKILARLSVIEGVLNLFLDILFVKTFNMGVAGAGFGTAAATIIRCIMTLAVLIKATDFFKTGGAKPQLATIKDILRTGLPYAANIALLVLQEYLMIMILIRGFGTNAGIILCVCNFCYGLYGVTSTSVTDSMRPLVGLMSGAEDIMGIKLLIRQGMITLLLLLIALVGVIMTFPGVFYSVFSVDTIPEGGILSLRIYAVYFFPAGMNDILRLFMVNQKDTGFASMMPVFRTAVRIIAAYLFSIILPAPFIWLAFLFSEGAEGFLNIKRYAEWIKGKDQKPEGVNILYLSVKPSEAIEASRMIRNYTDALSYPKKMSYRISLVMEEMAAYTKQVREGSEVESQIVIRLEPDKAVFLMIDNGRQIVFDDDMEKIEIVTDNYNLIKRLASSFEYQYILNMNYTRIRIEICA